VRFVAVLLAVLAIMWSAVGAGSARAEGVRPYSFQLGAALIEPISDTRQRFSAGFGLTLGATLQPLSALGVRLDYMASAFDVRSGVLPGATIDGDQLLQSWSLQVVVTPLRGPRAAFYALAGGGLHLRSVDITSTRGAGVAAVCDAWLLECFDGAAAVAALSGSHHELDYGVHIGLGADFALDPRAHVFLEARFVFIWGDGKRAPTGTISRANSEYVPIVLGVDF
jgi:hypothetical protein